jgi:hypothetical protein
LRLKESAPFIREKRGTILPPIKFQQETSVRFEKSCSDILDKKFPVGGCPFEPFSVLGTPEPVKTNAVAGDKIEFFPEIG